MFSYLPIDLIAYGQIIQKLEIQEFILVYKT